MSRNRPSPQTLNNNVNRDNPSISQNSQLQQRRYQQQQQQHKNATSPPSSRPTSPSSPSHRSMNSNPFDDNSNPSYNPKDYYNNNANSRAFERRDSNQQNQQKKIIWNHQLEQQQRQQIQKYQQYQHLQHNKPNNEIINDKNQQFTNDTVNINNEGDKVVNHNNDDDDGDESGEVSDFFQNVYTPSSSNNRNDYKSRMSVISMAESVPEQLPSSTNQKDSSEKSVSKLRSSNDHKNINFDQNNHDNVEMNVLNDKKNPKLSRTKSHRPRPHAEESSVPLSNNNDDDSFPTERPKSPSKSLLRMPSIMRSYNDNENPSSNLPRRQKSLVRPERARNNNYNRRISRGAMSTRQMYDGSDEESRFSVFSGNGNGGDDRRKSTMSIARRNSMKDPPRKRKWYKCQCPSCWILFSRIVTFWAPPSLLSCFGMHDRLVQQAWREKMALVFIIFILCIVVGFLTFGFETTVCRKAPLEGIQFGHMSLNQATILGKVYDLSSFPHPVVPPYVKDSDLANPVNGFGRSDLSFLFQSVNFECKNVLIPKVTNADGSVLKYFPCVVIHENDDPNPTANPQNGGCHVNPSERVDALSKFKVVGQTYFEWSDVDNPDNKYVVYNGQVLDLDRFLWKDPNIDLPDTLIKLINDDNDVFHGRDITHYLHSDNEKLNLAKCMEEIIKVGVIDEISISCLITDVVTYVSFIVIVGVVLVRFFLAVLFGWILSWRLGSFREETADDISKREKDIERWSNENNHFNSRDSSSSSFKLFNLNKSRFSTLPPPGSAPFVDRRRQDGRTGSRMYSAQSAMVKDSNGSARTSRPSSIINENNNSRANSMSSTSSSSYGQIQSLNPVNETRFNFPLLHTIMLVTCYSEGLQGIKTTLNSLARTDYPTSHKLIMIIADGVIFGSGNDLSTPDICLSLMHEFVVPRDDVIAHSYVAIADGKKRHNMAKVYAGYYKCRDQHDHNKVLKIPIVTIVKCGGPDEQDEKKPGNRGKRDSQMILMSFLQKVMFDERMTPLEYEFFNSIRTVTGVTPDHFEIVLMVVFEYYISHHMQKAFESIFGGVTCLPGCFCMYRIKAPKGPNGYWVPILANPDIVEQYSENIVDTLHKKNLLLLGEDRYLSTLMLRTFPKRKMVFVPQAVCKTIVPDTFRVLRSQRRRWINSTVHNLLELVLIPDLCGTFCFSMQFVIFMELVGTVVLPAAITFTLYLIIISFVKKPVPYLPLALLGVVLGLPAILILLTTRKIVYVGWMLIYLFSLPIWNFVLPVYAYWHFDDFSWGQTRKVEGEEAGKDHSRKEGEFDSTQIVMKRWAEWEREKQYKTRGSISSIQQHISSAPLSSEEGYSNSRPGSEKSSYYTPSPLNPVLRTGGKRNTGPGVKTRAPTSDSLKVPPPLSNYSSPPDSTNSSSTLTTDAYASTPTEIDYQQNIIPRSNNNNNFSYSSDNNNSNFPGNFEEAHLRDQNGYDSS
ncbi:glycosyltransferase family 2 protein [Rhizophagus irregularis DAOM 181602=DAOM 197198]|uniref:chitin synthase n=1 Tax=Rhizophagus irregularis (strain DAOM 181602 / DAOM 197198 / MUCL 43194) TaxID=747089 RepID=A0A2P4Q7B1_RHIID|nr:glycosyltransferase family 2 protein [Rhizophagus irregularis DAOM 181602=DAOM 197198]POG73526.1 glycosyltransferase family 2 protein [Rhizophagus irregularis DAOM 181602=DAOM 197198]|eukprot:XP_025180392.1 glycosyltransferase family 2 protein [Rhizophagus irregularis DAOM 181602=DAOM 197198]